MRLPLWALLVALLAGCSAPAPGDDPPAFATPPPDSHIVSWSLGPREGRELNFELAEGASIAYDLDADAPVRWDLHSHTEAGAVTTHASGEERAASGEFTAPAADVYSIFARATGAPTVVTVTIEGVFELVDA